MTPAPRIRLMPIALMMVLTITTTGALYVWARQTIAIPGCTAGAAQEHLRFLRYVPVELSGSNRSTPDGRCIFAGADNKPIERSLTRYLRGVQQLTSFGLRYDLIGLAMFLGWGFLIGTIVKARDSRNS